MARGLLLGTGVMLVCLLVPFVNFVTGPLAPLIGGFVGGYRARAGGRQVVALGLVLGILVVFPVWGLLAFNAGTVRPSGPWWSLPAFLSASIGYGVSLATLGALLGGRWAQRVQIRQGPASGQEP
ncbi:MAG: hypothetical protein HY683_06840 [Chloroflexi bacterium]|nr:hypothetical protein [Chloroflexota bacterium]